jgi:hypothetical protein
MLVTPPADLPTALAKTIQSGCAKPLHGECWHDDSGCALSGSGFDAQWEKV